jgi:predicted ester cyclase
MSTPDPKAIVGRFFQSAINEREFAALDDLIAPDFALHSSVLGEVRGATAFKESALALVKPCPDLQVTVDDLLAAEHNIVVARVTYRGTDTGGVLPGAAPTGKPFEFTALYLWRVIDGRLAELWQEADRLRLVQQLGSQAAPSAGASRKG